MLKFISSFCIVMCVCVTSAFGQTADYSLLRANVEIFDHACLRSLNDTSRKASDFLEQFPSAEMSQIQVPDGPVTTFQIWKNHAELSSASLMYNSSSWSCAFYFLGDDTASVWRLVSDILGNRHNGKVDIIIGGAAGPMFVIETAQASAFIDIFTSSVGSGGQTQLVILARGQKE